MVLAYPRYHTLDALPLPMGRRYQPGGIPLASVVGDSLEFVGTREYREGDPLRKIDWRSWARLGRPVVREYQEEYFSRIALVLDTFLGKRPRPRERARFEAAISTLASVAEHFSRSEEVVDILAAGPDLYEVSTGRSLGYLDNVLDVLACLEPSPAPPFESIGPPLFERLERPDHRGRGDARVGRGARGLPAPRAGDGGRGARSPRPRGTRPGSPGRPSPPSWARSSASLPPRSRRASPPRRSA